MEHIHKLETGMSFKFASLKIISRTVNSSRCTNDKCLFFNCTQRSSLPSFQQIKSASYNRCSSQYPFILCAHILLLGIECAHEMRTFCHEFVLNRNGDKLLKSVCWYFDFKWQLFYNCNWKNWKNTNKFVVALIPGL